MALSNKAVQRLAALGFTSVSALRFWNDIWHSQGEAFFESCFREFVQKRAAAAAEYRRWFPKLQAFTAECRRSLPAPNVSRMPVAEREKQRVLIEKMREFAESEDFSCVRDRKPDHVAILSTTRVGLAAAQEVFGGTDAVILEESERERWFSEVYRPATDGFWWYAFRWWTLREGLPQSDEEIIRASYPIPTGSAYWVVESGEQSNELASGANHELWRWDGARAEFVALYTVETH